MSDSMTDAEKLVLAINALLVIEGRIELEDARDMAWNMRRLAHSTLDLLEVDR